MPQLVRLVLTSEKPFDEAEIAYAKRKIREDLPALLRQANSDVVPAQEDWITDRLRLLWKSTTPTNNIEAVAWLHETGRLIKHLPQDILTYSIDEVVRRSEKNFTPAAGAILAIAEPMMNERMKIRARLDILVNGQPKPQVRPWEPQDTFAGVERCSPDEAAEILKSIGLDLSESSQTPQPRDYSNLRKPTPHELQEARISTPSTSDIRSSTLQRMVEARRAASVEVAVVQRTDQRDA